MARKLEREGAEKMIGVDALRKLIALGKNVKGRIDTARGELGQKISDAQERQNLHPQAFATIRRLEAMDIVKMRAWLDHFDYYRDVLLLDERKAKDLFKDQPELDDKAGAKARKAAAKAKGNGKPAKAAKVGRPPKAGNGRAAASKNGQGDRADEGDLAKVGRGTSASVGEGAPQSGTTISRSAFKEHMASQGGGLPTGEEVKH